MGRLYGHDFKTRGSAESQVNTYIHCKGGGGGGLRWSGLASLCTI